MLLLILGFFFLSIKREDFTETGSGCHYVTGGNLWCLSGWDPAGEMGRLADRKWEKRSDS